MSTNYKWCGRGDHGGGTGNFSLNEQEADCTVCRTVPEKLSGPCSFGSRCIMYLVRGSNDSRSYITL